MNTFSEQLRFWRKSKGFSQLSLALVTEVSSKHISHMENGRSKPSRAMVLRLSEVLDTPLSTRNEWLNLLGFADHYMRTPLEQHDMHRLNKTLNIILEKQEPYPAIVLDWHWNIVLQNKGFDRLLNQIRVQCPGFSQSANIARLVFSDDGLKPLLSNWDEVAHTTLLRLKKEQQAQPGRHDDLLQAIHSLVGLPEKDHRFRNTIQTEPFIYVDMLLAGQSLKFLTTLTAFGTPIDVTAAELQIECYYPADESTQLFLSECDNMPGRT